MTTAAQQPARQPEPVVLRGLLKTPAYRRTLLLCALVGIPVSLVCFWFLAGLHELQRLLWESLPHSLGWDGPPWWWPLPLLLVGGIGVGLVVARMPGAGGTFPPPGWRWAGPRPRCCRAWCSRRRRACRSARCWARRRR